MGKWKQLKKFVAKEKVYYRLNTHAVEWLEYIQNEMARIESRHKGHGDEICTTVTYDKETGRSEVCGKPRGHWRK